MSISRQTAELILASEQQRKTVAERRKQLDDAQAEYEAALRQFNDLQYKVIRSFPEGPERLTPPYHLVEIDGQMYLVQMYGEPTKPEGVGCVRPMFVESEREGT